MSFPKNFNGFLHTCTLFGKLRNFDSVDFLNLMLFSVKYIAKKKYLLPKYTVKTTM